MRLRGKRNRVLPLYLSRRTKALNPVPHNRRTVVLQLTDILDQTGGLKSIARELNIGEDEAARAAAALGPAVLGGFRKQAEADPKGLEGLGGLLNQLGGGGMLDAVLSSSPTDTAPGNNVLGQIFGSKDVSRAVAQNAAAQSGQDPSLLKKMLPMLAMLVAGYMAKKRGAMGQGASALPAGGFTGMLGGMLGNKRQDDDDEEGFGGLLNMGGQRNPLDDIIGRLGR
jgi:hypothetical protein